MNALIQPGRILAGRYRIDQQIGVGGMAVVYRATDLNTQHFVAVKVLKPEYNQDAEYVARFQREAEAASKMTHHNIVNLAWIPAATAISSWSTSRGRRSRTSSAKKGG